MKMKCLLPTTVLVTFATILGGNIYAQTWGNALTTIPTYTSGSVGVGSAPTITTSPTDAWMHIYGQAASVPGTEALGGPCTTLGYTNPELWIDRQVDFTYSSTCFPTTPSANYFQVSNSGPSFSGYVTGILDVINNKGWLGILNPNPAEALDVNGSGIIKQKLYVKGDLIDMSDAADLWRTIRAKANKGVLALNANTSSTDGGSIEIYGPNAAAGRGGNVHFCTVGDQRGGFNFYNYTGGTYQRQMNIANTSGLVTIDHNLDVVGGQVTMPMTTDIWRNINALSTNSGLSVSAGYGGGAYQQYSAGSFSDKGAIQIVCNNGGTGTTFWSYDAGGNWSGIMRLQPSAGGQVIIGKNIIGGGGYASVPAPYGLIVEKGILTEKLKVATRGTIDWADFVFDDNYKLNTLSEIETYVSENNHLPGIPSACEVQENGIDMVEMDSKLLQKIEELTLYTIQQQKQIDEQRNLMAKQQVAIDNLMKKVSQ
jgi:hypothetical protein